MKDYLKTIFVIFFSGLFFLTCKKEEDFRIDLVGTYIILCTEHQYQPYLGPGTSYPTDTTDVDKSIQVSFDSNDILMDNKGEIKVNGRVFNIVKDNSGIRYSALTGHFMYHTGNFVLPNKINYHWNDVNSAAAFEYNCRGVKL
ncbi:MAG: hypothetical protein AB8F94_18705 [Saprospiraceae bacterium]